MQRKVISALATAAVVSAQCEIPTTPLSDTILSPFRVQVQNASYPQVHNSYMNLFEAGGGDQHLFVGPVGTPTYNLVLRDGVIGRGELNAVIGGEDSEIDDTIKLFMTGRADPGGVFQPTYACNPDTGDLQVEFQFVGMENNTPGGWICVRPAFEGSHEFRYYPPNNDKFDPNRFCIKVTLVMIPWTGPIPSETTTPVPSATATTLTTVTTSSGPTPTPSLFADMTSEGWAFIGCAPEERRVEPADTPGRTLQGTMTGSDTMTNEFCMSYCGNLGYTYAGTEWSRECFCDNSYAPTRQPATTLASLANCNFRCSGDAGQFCGGDAWLSLYEACEEGEPCVNAAFT